MYTLSSWRSHLGILAVDLLHQERARTVGDPFTAYIPGEVTQVSRITNVQPKFLEKSPRYRGWPMYTLSSWRSHLGIVAVILSHQEYPSVMLDPRAINKLAEFVSPRFRSESAQNSPGIRPAYPDFRPESARNPRWIIFNGEYTLCMVQ